MEIERLTITHAAEVTGLFRDAFTDSEGEGEGDTIAALVNELAKDLNRPAVLGYSVRISQKMVGAIFFSQMRFESELNAFILAPVAVHSSHQGKGIGQMLIRHGLDDVAKSGAQFVATYGDPAFYSRVGFQRISEQTLRPPFPLSQPEGWLGQSLEGEDVDTYSGLFGCVEAFNKASLW